MVICLEWGAYLHMAQLMPLPLTVSCFRKIQIRFTFLVPAHLGSPGQRAAKRLCVCVCVCVFNDGFVANLLHNCWWQICKYSVNIWQCYGQSIFDSQLHDFYVNLHLLAPFQFHFSCCTRWEHFRISGTGFFHMLDDSFMSSNQQH